MTGPPAELVSFALERAWELVCWLRLRSRSVEARWAARLVRDIESHRPGLLDADGCRRLDIWLRRAQWDRLLELGDETGDAVVDELDREVFRTWNPDDRHRARELVGAIWEALWRQSNRDQLFALSREIEARRGRRHLDAFLSVLADDHVILYEELQAIGRSLQSLADEMRKLPFEPEAPVPPDLPRHVPSLLLRPQLSTVPFLFRQDVLDRLTAWCEQTATVEVLVVTGPGGSGKTRLGLELCRAVRERGWSAGFLDRSATLQQVHAFGGDESDCLVVVDYAETRREKIGMLLGTRLGASAGRLRVVLLVRAAAREGQDVVDRLGRYHAGADAVMARAPVVVLQPPPVPERRALFDRAVRAFAEALGRHDVEPAAPPLHTDTFGNVLFVLLVALDAVLDDGTAGGRRCTPHRDVLLAEALQHERRHWARQAADAGVALDTEVVGRAVAVATLLGAEDESSAAELLQLVPDLCDSPEEVRRRLARLLHRLYPGPDYLNGLEPDLLGEALVREVVEQVPTLLGAVFDTRQWLRLAEALRVVARAAADRPTTVAQVQEQLHEDALVLVVRTFWDADEDAKAPFADALADLLEVAPVPNVLYCLGEGVPRHDLALVDLGAVVARQAADSTRELVPVDPSRFRPELGERLFDLSERLAEAGRSKEALAAMAEAVEVFRALVAEDRSTFLEPLAACLTVLTKRLADVADSDAVEVGETALATARELVELDREEFLPVLATALEFPIDVPFQARLGGRDARRECRGHSGPS